LPKTQADRLASGDPRLSIAERYPTHESYANAVRTAATDLQQQRLLLEADVQSYIQAAEASPIGR
jgi:hypothetical protein